MTLVLFSEFPGNCLDFDGIYDNVESNGITTTFNSITLEAWIYHYSLPSGEIQRYVFFDPEVAILRYDGSNGNRQLHFLIKQSNGAYAHIRINDILTTNEWLHVAVT